MDLTLGAVQFGLPYGKRVGQGLLGDDEIFAILSEAKRSGIHTLDCAQAYGQAEAVLGRARRAGILSDDERIITKVICPADSQSRSMADLLAEQLRHSRQQLAVPALDAVLLHRFSDRAVHGGGYWQALVDAKASGQVQKIGVSVYLPEEAIAALEDPEVDLIQLPFNILDHRWLKPSFLDARTRRGDSVEIHCRSIYLQGSLISDLAPWPYLERRGLREWQARLDKFAAQAGCGSRAELCFRYVHAQEWINSLVIGVDDIHQLRESVGMLRLGPLDRDIAAEISLSMRDVPEDILNPTTWGKS